MQTTFTTISKHCWPLAVTIPILQLSWAIWNFLKIPWSLMTPGCTTHSFLFLEAFPIWHVPNISFKTHFKYYFPWEAFSNSPRLLIFLLSLIFNLHIYLFTLEFLPFPLGKKCSINCFLSLILSFFICSPEYSTLLTAPRSVLWPCKKHSVNHVFKKKFSAAAKIKWIWGKMNMIFRSSSAIWNISLTVSNLAGDGKRQ